MLKDRIRKIEEKLKINYPEIIVTRMIVDCVNGILCYVGKYDRKTEEYLEFNPPIPINKMEDKNR